MTLRIKIDGEDSVASSNWPLFRPFQELNLFFVVLDMWVG